MQDEREQPHERAVQLRGRRRAARRGCARRTRGARARGCGRLGRDRLLLEEVELDVVVGRVHA